MAEVPGLGLHFLQQIVNVQWGGAGEFAIGGTIRDATQEGPIGVFYSMKQDNTWRSTHMDPGSPTPPPPSDNIPVPSGGDGPRGPGMWENNIVAMVGGKITEDETEKKILVAGGSRVVMTHLTGVVGATTWHYNFQNTATLFWSDDGGKTWTEVPCPVTAPPGESDDAGTVAGSVAVNIAMQYVCFDPATKTFYGDVLKNGNEHGNRYVERSLISSRDGKHWSLESSDRRASPNFANWTSPFLSMLPSIKGNGLTEIIDTDADTEIKLTYTTNQILPSQFGGALLLAPPWRMDPVPVGPVGEGGMAIGDIPYGERVANGARFAGIAYANGSFLIAGSLMATDDDTNFDVKAYVSQDKGRTWKKTLDDGATFTICDTINEVAGCAGSCGCAGA